MNPAVQAPVTLTVADTEYAVSVPACQGFTLTARRLGDGTYPVLKVKTSAAGNYITLPGGTFKGSLNSPGAYQKAKTYYVESPSAGAVVELVVW